MLRTLSSAFAFVIAVEGFAALELSGCMRSKDTLRFVVTDLDSGSKSGFYIKHKHNKKTTVKR